MKYSESIDQARELQKTYHPNDRVANTIKEKNLVMFVAPAACGKTYVMNQLAAHDERFKRIPTFTTREPRPDDDPGMFHYLPHDNAHITKLLSMIHKGELVQYVVHPSGRFYGSEPLDYPGDYNMLATLSFIVEPMAKLPFKDVHVIGVITDVTHWEKWFNERFPVGHPERPKRLQEADKSLEWLLAYQHNNAFSWIDNQPDAPASTVKTLLDAILYNKKQDNASLIAEAIRKRAKEMMI